MNRKPLKRSWIKRSKSPRKRKTERQLIIDQCDDIARDLVLKRDNYTCQYSGKKDNLQWCHFKSRGNLHLRWVLDNAITLNGGIHIFTMHKHPDIMRELMIKRIGLEKVEKFEMMSRVRTRPLYTVEIKIIRDELRKLL